MPPKLVCITGPTASGKTALAVALARAHGGEVVGADSMQIYRGMEIGTAAPTALERAAVPHHMFGILEPGTAYSAARYAEDAAACVEDIRARGALPVVCGGTGLYIDALTGAGQLSLAPEPSDAALRAALSDELARQGAQTMHDRLAALDPACALKLHPNDTRRVLRALEIHALTGKIPTERNRANAAIPPRYTPCIIGLCPRDREVLYARINRRVDEMIRNGLPAEAHQLWQAGLLTGTAAQAIGYKELVPYFEGQCSLEDAVEMIRQASRRYAKRQLTWLRRMENVHWIYYEEDVKFSLILHLSQDYLKSCAII